MVIIMFKNKILLKNLLIFLLIFIIIFSINYFYIVCGADEIWTYGFSYNITKGLLPYLNYNMVVLPFHSFFIAFPMMLFGNSLLMWHIINALIITTCFYFINKKIGLSKTLFLVIAMMSFDSYSYNVYISLALIFILLFERSNYKYKDLIIGLLIGSIMMTKVNIGAFLFLVYFFKSKEKLKVFLYAAIIPFITLIYLLITNSLLPCIDYCLLGIKNFSNNVVIDYYFLVFIMMCYPICDYNHFPMMIWPLLFYLLLTLKNKNNITIVKGLLVVLAICSLKTFRFNYNTLDSEFFGIRRINLGNRILDYSNYVKENSNKNIFIFEFFAYMVKLDADVPITKYDLINRGNMGHDDLLFLKEIDKICKSEGCVILTDFYEFNLKYTQFRKEYLEYVKKYFELCDKDFVYCMKKVSCKSIEDK